MSIIQKGSIQGKLKWAEMAARLIVSPPTDGRPLMASEEGMVIRLSDYIANTSLGLGYQDIAAVEMRSTATVRTNVEHVENVRESKNFDDALVVIETLAGISRDGFYDNAAQQPSFLPPSIRK